MQNFRLSTAHVKFHQIFTLIGSFYWKYTKFQLESTEDLFLISLKSELKFEKILICCFKNDKNLVSIVPSTQNLQKCANYITFDLRKYKGVIFYHTGVSYKIWKKLTRGLENDMWNLANFDKNNWKCQNWDFNRILLSKIENAELKHYRGVMCNDTEEWKKFKEELTRCFKIDIRNLTNFDSSTQKSQKLPFNELLLTKLYGVWDKKYRGVMFDANFEGKLTIAFKNDMRNLANFHQSTRKSQIWNLQTSYVSWQWRIMQNLKRNWLVQNWHEEFDGFWSEHSKISKICTLMGCFWSKGLMFELKKYIGVMFHGSEDWCKIWRKTDFAFQTDISKFSQTEK